MLNELARVRYDLSAEKRQYRVVLLGPSGEIVEMHRVSAQNDDEARRSAEALVSSHPVELLDGARYIDHYPVWPPSYTISLT